MGENSVVRGVYDMIVGVAGGKLGLAGTFGRD